MTDRDAFAEGERAARANIPAKGSRHAHQPIRFRPFLKRGPLAT
jgi:hypothetical protein